MKPLFTLALLALAVPALAQDLPPAEDRATCTLTIEGQEKARGACTVTPLDTDGSFTAAWKEGGLFVYLLMDAPLLATAYWNGTPEAQKAHDPLGQMWLDNACWLNKTASICLY